MPAMSHEHLRLCLLPTWLYMPLCFPREVLTWLPPITWAGGQPGCDICQSNGGQASLATPTLFDFPNVPLKD